MPREKPRLPHEVRFNFLTDHFFRRFRHVLADPRNALVPAVRLVHDAVHVLVDRRAQHHDQRLQLLPPDSHPGHDGGDAVGPLRDPHRARGTAQEKVQSEHLKHVPFSNGNTFTHILNI